MKTKPLFDAAFRRELHQLLTDNKMGDSRVAQAIDLACHAAEEAIERLSGVCKTAPDLGIQATAMELALQLAADHMSQHARQMHELAKKLGVPQRAGHFTMGGNHD